MSITLASSTAKLPRYSTTLKFLVSPTKSCKINTLVVFDSRVQDLEILYKALLPDTSAFTITAQEDALNVITQLLTETGAKKLAIVAHGESGVVHIGANSLNIEQIEQRSHLLQEWGVSEIALYSCEVAKGDRGQAFLDQLGKVTGAVISGSTSLVGKAELGGNWHLQVSTSLVEQRSVFCPDLLLRYEATLTDGSNINNSGLIDSLDNSLTSFHNILRGLSQDTDRFYSVFGQAFGSDFNSTLAETIRSQWASGDFSQIPAIQVLGSGLNGALGAYATSNNTIYLSEELLASSSEQIVAVILEEIGHYVDAQINSVDTVGDEGQLFSALVRGEILSDTQITAIQGENDAGFITVNGESIAVERASANNNVSLTISEGGTVVLNGSNFSITDPDNTAFNYTASGVTGGSFQTFDGSVWTNAITFNSTQVTDGKVRFVHDGNEAEPTFQIQADDGETSNNLSSTINGTVIFTNVNDAPIASNAFATGNEDDAYIVITLQGNAVDTGEQIDGFQVNQLPDNGTLFLDAALTNPVLLKQVIDTSSSTLPLYFRPNANFNGSVSFPYVAIKTLPFSSGSGGRADNYFLTVNGLAGDAVDGIGRRTGAFEVSGFSFDVDALVAAGGLATGAGSPNFSPLSVALKDNEVVNGLLQKTATGSIIPLIRLEGIATLSDGTGKTVYDLRLGDVRVTKVTDSNGEDRVEFNYGKISLTTRDRESLNNTAQIFAYDLANNLASTTELAVAAAATSSSGGRADNYFLTVNGLAGDAVDRIGRRTGAFEVSGFSFDVDALVAAGGLATGRPNFSPLSVALKDNEVVSGLLQKTATGSIIPLIRLEGIATLSDGTGKTVYDLRLGDVRVTKVTDSNGEDRVEFNYGKISLTTRDRESLNNTAQIFAYDLVNNLASTTELAVATAATSSNTNIESNVATVTINITPVNDAPLLSNVSLTISEGGTVVLNGSNFSITDPDNTAFNYTASGVTGGRFQTFDGSVWTNATTFNSTQVTDGSVRFVHDGNEAAPTFQIQANDGEAINNLSSTINGTVTFTNVNDAAVLTGTKAILADGIEDTLYAISTSDLLTGFTDVDGDTLSISGLTATNGTLNDNLDGTYSFTPTANFNDIVELSYNVIDGNGGITGATQSIAITAVNDAAVLTGAKAILADGIEDTLYSISTSDLLTGFTDVDGDTLSISGLTATNGSLIDNFNGTYSFAPNANFNGAVNLAYNVIDGNGGITGANQSIEITAVNDAPIATNDQVATSKGTAVTVALSDNVFDIEGLTGATLTTTDAVGGTTLINSNTQQITFTPNSSFVGTASFKYTITDSQGSFSNTATVTVEVGDNVSAGNQGQTVTGNNGNDSIFGGNGKDIISGLGGDDTLFGNNGADIIFGGDGNDKIWGGNGDDLLYGGSGSDQITGGNGSDRFVFTATSGTDTITDFVAGTDFIALSGGLSFGSLSFAGNNVLLASTNEILATLTGVNTSTLSAANFVNI